MSECSSLNRLYNTARRLTSEPRAWLEETDADKFDWLMQAVRSDDEIRYLLAELREGGNGISSADAGGMQTAICALLFVADGRHDAELGMTALESPVSDLRLHPVRIEIAEALLELPAVVDSPDDSISKRGSNCLDEGLSP